MDAHIWLTFGTHLGKTRTLRVNNVDRTVTDARVRQSMLMIMGTNAVHSLTTGLVNSLRGAAMVETTVTPIDLGV